MKNTLFLTLIILLSSCHAPIESKETLRSTVGQHFAIGCAVNTSIVALSDGKAHRLVAQQFNSIVAENCMKAEELTPREEVYHWHAADRFVKFGEKYDMRIIGHCLVWHSQAAEWMFYDKKGNFVTREVLIERMRNHIYTVVGRYKGRIYGWDVCNECVMDDGSMRNSLWQQIIGDDYIELAFQFAHEADPDAELYYNDYSMTTPAKVQTVCGLVRDLQSKGLRIDAVGMQCHNGLDYPTLQEWSDAIDSLASTGVKVNMTELDMNVLPRIESFSGAEVSSNFKYNKTLDPYRKGIPEEVEAQINQRWIDIFTMLKAHEHQIDRVTFWGVHDGMSWLNDWPIKGRKAYPLLFDRQKEPKPVVQDIVEMF